jgi:hypothetical protein
VFHPGILGEDRAGDRGVQVAAARIEQPVAVTVQKRGGHPDRCHHSVVGPAPNHELGGGRTGLLNTVFFQLLVQVELAADAAC